MPDYSQGKIYKILNSITNDTYIGSTTQLLCNRMKNHRNDHNNQNSTHYNYKLYKCFREHGIEHFYIELVEKYPCSSKEELLAREGCWIRQECPSLNSQVAGRTSKQYYEDNKEKIKQMVKKYTENNKDHVLESKKAYYEKVKDTLSFKLKRKEYAENHKQQIAEYGKQYREDNKDKLKERREEQIQCECGCLISRPKIQRHRRSRKHEQLMNTNS